MDTIGETNFSNIKLAYWSIIEHFRKYKTNHLYTSFTLGGNSIHCISLLQMIAMIAVQQIVCAHDVSRSIQLIQIELHQHGAAPWRSSITQVHRNIALATAFFIGSFGRLLSIDNVTDPVMLNGIVRKDYRSIYHNCDPIEIDFIKTYSIGIKYFL